jgi:hypothetical protein
MHTHTTTTRLAASLLRLAASFFILHFSLFISPPPAGAQQNRSATGTSSALDAALQSTAFAPEDGYAPGSLDGQRGWITLGQPASIVSSSLLPDSQALNRQKGSGLNGAKLKAVVVWDWAGQSG